MATAINRLAALCDRNQGARLSQLAAAATPSSTVTSLQRLVPRAIELMPSFGPHALANAMHGVGKLGYQDGVLLDAAIARATDVANQMNPQELSNFVWGYAKVCRADGLSQSHQHRVAKVRKVLLARGAQLMPEFNQQNFANFIWALAVLDWQPSGRLRQAIFDSLPVVAVSMSGQSLSVTIWGLATLGTKHVPEGIMRTISKRLTTLVSTMGPQSIANITWGFANLGCSLSLNTRIAIERQATKVKHDFKPQEIANFLWASAAMSVRPSEQLLSSLEDVYINSTGTPLVGTVSSIAMSLQSENVGKVGNVNGGDDGGSPTGKDNDGHVSGNSDTMDSIFNTLSVFPNKLNPHSRSTSPAISTVRAKPSEVASLLWSYASLGIDMKRRRPDMLAHLSGQAFELMGQMKDYELSTVLWSFSVFDVLSSSPIAYQLLRTLLTKAGEADALDTRTQGQLHLTFMCIDQDISTTKDALALQDLLFEYRELVDLCAHQYKKEGKGASSSVLQDKTIDALRELLASRIEEEVVLDRSCGYLSADAFVPEHNIAIEVNGPFHYVGGLDPTVSGALLPNGSTLLKHRILRRAGVHVITLQYRELQDHRSKDSMIRFLRNRLVGSK